MAIDTRYIPAFSIEDVLLDKNTGAPLSGGLVYFWQDNQRGTPKNVWQITGTSPNYTFIQLPNPMTLSAIGTFVDSLDNPVVPYFLPYNSDGEVELYYIEVLSSGLVPQFDREAVPFVEGGGTTEIGNAFNNEISNPQFAEVLFDTSSSSYTYTFNNASQEIVDIAPDWQIVVSCTGVGTVTVEQIIPTGSNNVITNPGTILGINSGSITRLKLRQTLSGSSNLWGDGYLAGSFIAKTFAGTTSALSLYYSQSNGTVVDELIKTATLTADGLYNAFAGSVLIPQSNSADSFPDGDVYIEFDIPLSTHVAISSVMVKSTGAISVDEIVYDQESQNRQIDHLFHYYQPQLNFKPIPSLLVGWDFPLNPAQPHGPTTTMKAMTAPPTAAESYVWDQTIAESVVGNIAVVRNSVTGGIQCTTGNSNEAFYFMQYLTGNQAKKILNTTLSVNINAFRTQAGGAVTAQAYLFRAPSTSTIPSLPTTIGTVAANGTFTLTGVGWTAVARGYLGNATGTLSIVDTTDYSTLADVEDLSFNGWEITDATQLSDTNLFAVVVTYSCPTSGTVVVTNSISVVPGDIPTRPAPQTVDEVLRECQYYYETSYKPGDAPGTSTLDNMLMYLMPAYATATPNVGTQSGSFMLQYMVPKLSTTPTITFYNSVGTSGSVDGYAYSTNSAQAGGPTTAVFTSFWSLINSSNKLASYAPNSSSNLAVTTGAQTNGPRGALSFHYVADSRLGIV